MLACSMQTRSGGLFDTSHKIAALNFLSGKQKKKKKKKPPSKSNQSFPRKWDYFHKYILLIFGYCAKIQLYIKMSGALK